MRFSQLKTLGRGLAVKTFFLSRLPRVSLFWAVALALLAVSALPGFGAEPGAAGVRASAEPSTLSQLTVIRSNIELIGQLRRQGVEVDAAGAIVQGLLADAAQLTAGRVVSLETLVVATGTAPTPYERVKGWFTFTNILGVVGVMIMLATCAMLFRHYLAALIARVPLKVWELLFYVGCVGAIVAGPNMPKGFTMAPVVPGCLGLLGCFFFSVKIHNFTPKGWMAWFFVGAWGGSAVYYGNETLGFMAVLAGIVGLGFFARVFPGVVMLGFRNSAVIPRTTIAAGILLGAHVALHCLGLAPVWLDPFRGGMGFVGAFVYMLGLLILSCWYYSRSGGRSEQRWKRYAVMQVVTIVSGMATLYFGSVYRVDSLLWVGGAFFYLYLLEKFCELPWRGVGWIWAMFCLGGWIYAFSVVARANPGWFPYLH